MLLYDKLQWSNIWDKKCKLGDGRKFSLLATL